DRFGSAVSNVDLTAFSVNSLLDYSLPDLPYYGAAPATREQRDSYSMNRKNYLLETPLNFDYWNKLAKLDTLEYYRFAYPRNKMFLYTVNTPDTTTEFAPYIMKDGKAIDIYVIEKNDKPIYFSWTQQPKAYSFLADMGKQKITLRLFNKAIVFDSIQFAPGKKTILSIEENYLPANTKVIDLNNKTGQGYYIFTSPEAERYNKLISEIPVKKYSGYTYLKQDSVVYPVYAECLSFYKEKILAGPIPEGATQYMEDIKYKHEGGFSYKYDSNVVYKYSAQLLPQTLVFSSNNNFNQLNDFCFTQKLFQRKLNEYKEIMPYWNPGSIYIVKDGMILNFKLPQNIDSSGISNLLLYNRSQNKMLYFNAFESGYKFYDYIPQDTYDAVALYNDGRYLKYDNVFLKKYYYTEVNMSNLPLQKPDSFSAKWLMLNLKKCYNNNTFKQDENQLRKAYPNDVVISSITIAPVRAFGNTVSGFVYDKEGLPLQGATVTITGTSNGTVTDESGYFVLNIIGKNASLAVSFVGYETATVYATAGSRINITMTQMESYLEEVVVIGYGTTRKRSVTGSASSISSNEMMRNPSENIDNALQGKVAGVSITKTNEEDEAENKLYDELRLLNGLRSNFSDVGFWQPALYTNKKGEAKFSITFPDNITSWDAVVFAMNRQLKTGTLKTAIKSYKPLMAELKTPSFLIAGDTSFFAANIRNYTKDSVISGVVNFSVNNKTELQNNIRFTSSKQDKLPVPASSEDSLTASYLFTRNDGYNDGEQRTIPIFSVGTEVAKGTLNILRNGDSIYLQANNNEKIHVNITADNLDIYMNAAYYLTGYQYACNEQLASKLIGLLNYKLYKQFKEEKFENDKQINEIIKRLRDNQNSKKLWSWWGQSDETSFWMSAHIIRALKMARDAGYEVNTSFNQIAVDYADIIPYRRISLNDIEIIHALSEWDAKQNYARAIDTLEKIVRRNEAVEDSLAIAFAHENKRYKPQSYLKEKLLLWDMRRKYNLGYVRDSLTKYLKKDILGRIYCEDGKQERYWYANDLTNTLIAYRMFKKDSALQHIKEAMQLYILATKNKGWNTYYASSAVMEILPDLLAASATKKQAATVAVSGKENKTISGFPYDIDLLPSEQLLIKKQTGIPLIYSAYSMQRVTQKNISDAFDITTSLGVDKLIAGQPIQLKTTLTVKQKNAEYVMIEIPIPASCSYQSKTNYYRFPEVHREYFKDRTVIFCQNLPEGVYTFTIDLLPRFTGKYSLNPAKASLMYFPVIEANNDWRKISVE
ncbi:MAG: carboxypeptidase-like regulatory domain-containing protein, partial [Chitinophagaceae bacterium]|nr:carboxypeptidase-like regulatory domain-containing protein [Chitinophagaceae bacterium]